MSSQQVFVQNHEVAPKLFVYLPLWAVNMFISIVKLTIRIYIYPYIALNKQLDLSNWQD